MSLQIPTLKDFNVKRKVALLPNGIRLVVFERLKAPIYIQALVDAGSIYDPVGKEGLAHFVEHMIVAGTKKYKTKDKLARSFEQYGGVFGARTAGETIALNFEIGESRDLDKAIKLLSDMINESIFSKKTLETERDSIITEIGVWRSDPGRYIWELWRKVLFQNTIKGRPILGTKKTVSTLDKDDVLTYVDKYFVTRRIIICLSGGVNVDEVSQIIKSKLNLKEGKKETRLKKIPEYRDQPIKVAQYPDSKHIHIVFGFRTCSAFHRDTIALRIISLVLGGGRASKLINKLRYERGLVYTASATASGSSNTGAWLVKTSTSRENVKKVINIISKEIIEVRSKGITEKDLEFAKNKYLKSARRRMQTSGEWVNFHSFGELYNQDSYLTLDKYLEKISEVTQKDVIEVARKYFKSDRWYMAVCGSISERDFGIEL